MQINFKDFMPDPASSPGVAPWLCVVHVGLHVGLMQGRIFLLAMPPGDEAVPDQCNRKNVQK